MEAWIDTRARSSARRTHGFRRTAHPRVPEPPAGVHHDPVHDARRAAVHLAHNSLAVSAARAFSVDSPVFRRCARAAQGSPSVGVPAAARRRDLDRLACRRQSALDDAFWVRMSCGEVVGSRCPDARHPGSQRARSAEWQRVRPSVQLSSM